MHEASSTPTSNLCRAVTACLACGATSLDPVLDLGQQPLANNLVKRRDGMPAEPTFPLGIQLCQRCHLVQLTHIVDPDQMFSSYLYVPSTSTTWLAHCDEIAADVCARAGLSAGELVVEIGSNDGALLKAFQRRGLRVLGVDPAANIAGRANAEGVPTLNRFFGADVATEILAEHGPARAIVSTNVLAHVPDPVGVLRGVRTLLGPQSIYVNESPSLREMVVQNEFDTIYHEHVSYYSLHALENMAAQAGLHIIDAVPQAIHGGSLRIVAARDDAAMAASSSLPAVREAEREAGVLDPHGLGAFASRTAELRDRLRELVGRLRADGLRIAAYGATAKGTVLLTYCGLTNEDIDYIVDRNPLKQGHVTPGSRIPVVSPEHLEAEPPAVLLLLAWNLADEIRKQLAWFSARGGQFLIPVPEPCLVSGDEA
jgi:novobiocin biosynthesis protein NovU/D-mycarose 3-C-methyltransferase